MPIDSHSEGSLAEKQVYYVTGKEFTKGSRCTFTFCTIACTSVDWCNVAWMTIDLPDVVLLALFDFYVDEIWPEAWYKLVHVTPQHVCRKWRNVVFGSPHRLKLRLYCTAGTPVRKTLDVWPPLPISVRSNGHNVWCMNNIIAALEHNDRICELGLFDIPSSQLETVLETMQRPFPTLTRLQLQSREETVPLHPNSFLGGSAPRLQSLFLDCIPFPGLPKLLLSATDLVDLDLRRIPHSGYISPEAMVTGLSVLTRLESLVIIFHFSVSRLRWKSRPLLPLKPIVLPVLTKLHFGGACEYLDYLVAQIYVPLLDNLKITFFVQEIFDTPQFAQFVSRTPKFEAQGEARVEFLEQGVGVKLLGGKLKLEFACPINGHLSSLAQVCVSCLPQALIHGVERLYIFRNIFWPLSWEDNSINQWLEGLHPFTAVKDVYISQDLVPNIMRALHELVGERVTEFLPAMRTLFLADPPSSEPFWEWEEAIGHFVAARELAGHPFVVSRWVRKAGDE